MGTRTPDLYRVKVDLASLINRLITGLIDTRNEPSACQSGAWVMRCGQGTGFKQVARSGRARCLNAILPAAALADLIATLAIGDVIFFV